MFDVVNLKILFSVWGWVTLCMSFILMAQGEFRPTRWLAAGTGVSALLGFVVMLVLGIIAALSAWVVWVTA